MVQPNDPPVLGTAIGRTPRARRARVGEYLTTRLRWLVLATDQPPLNRVYRAYYALVIRLAVRMFRSNPEVCAVYLRRGVVKGDIFPLISDVDLTVIVDNGSPECLDRIRRRYRRLARLTVILDPNLELYERDTLLALRRAANVQFYLFEGKATWKLLYGEDYLAAFPSTSLRDIYAGLYHEVKVWWSIFCWQLAQSRPRHDDTVQRNSVCYKAVSEIAKMTVALEDGAVTFRRSEALELAKPRLDPGGRALAVKLQAIASQRFLHRDPALLDETTAVLLRSVDRFCDSLAARWTDREPAGPTTEIDLPPDERGLSPAASAWIERLVEHTQTVWACPMRDAHLVSSAYFHLDEVLLLMEFDPSRLPTFKELCSLYQLHASSPADLRERIHVFLRMPHAAIQVDADYVRRGSRAALCPTANPEVFAQLATASCSWSGLAQQHIEEQKRPAWRTLRGPQLSAIDLWRAIWKLLQVATIQRSIAVGAGTCPLSIPAVERGLTQVGIQLPLDLSLARINSEPDLASLRRDAEAFLQEVVP